MNNIILLPLLIPLLGAILQFCFLRGVRVQRWLNLATCSLLLVSAIVLIFLVLKQQYIVLQVGGWRAPFGITLIADILAAIMVLLTAIVGFCVAIYSFSDIGLRNVRVGFYPAYNVLLFGLCGAFLTGDLFNLYVWFEVVLISSFILLVLSGGKFQLEAAVKYAVLNLIATLLLLSAIAFLYGITGTLNMADLALQVQDSHAPGLITVVAVLFIVAFSMKGAAFPLFFWLPASYHTTTYSSSAIFAGLLSKLGVYALIRVITLIFLVNSPYLHFIIAVLAGLTLLTGIMGAITHHQPRRVLSYSLISHIGFILVGLAISTPMALLAAIFYLIQHVVVKTGLFLSAGLIHYYQKSGFRCLYFSKPIFSVMFFILILSLSGIPPFSGFWPKLLLIESAIAAGQITLLVIMILVSLLTLYVMVRLWIQYFQVKQTQASFVYQVVERKSMLLSVAVLVGLALVIGLLPSLCYHLAKLTELQLLHPENYVHAVLKRTV